MLTFIRIHRRLLNELAIILYLEKVDADPICSTVVKNPG